MINHPLEACGKVAIAGGAGVIFGSAIALEIPLVTGIAIGTGVTLLGVGIFDSFKRMSQDKDLKHALDVVWKKTDYKSLSKANAVAEKVLGPETFDWAITIPTCAIGAGVGKFATKTVAAKLLSGKVNTTVPDAPEVINDCSAENCPGGEDCPETDLYWDRVAESKAEQEEWKIQEALEEQESQWKIYNLEKEWLASMTPEPCGMRYVKSLDEANTIENPDSPPLYRWSTRVSAEPVPLEYFEVPGKLVRFDSNKHSTTYIGMDRSWLPNYRRPNTGELVRVILSGTQAVADGEIWQPAEVALPEHYKPIRERERRISNEPFINNPSYDKFMRLHGIDPAQALDSELDLGW